MPNGKNKKIKENQIPTSDYLASFAASNAIKARMSQAIKDSPEDYGPGTAQTFDNLAGNVLSYFLGTHNPGTVPSKYKPTKAENPNAQYTTWKYLKNDVKRNLTSNQNIERINRIEVRKGASPLKGQNFEDYYNHYSNVERPSDNLVSGNSTNLGQYSLSAGKDDRGRYLSIHDKYDWNLLEGIGIHGNSWETYDRIYEDEWDKINIDKMKNGGTISKIGNNPNSPTMLFNGPSHENGGIPISYGGNQVEVEGGEPFFKDSQNNLQIFGKLKVPGMNKTFKKVVKEIADEETKTTKLLGKSLDLINNNNPFNKFQKYSFNSGTVMAQYAQNRNAELSAEKEQLAALQNVMLAVKEDTGEAEYGKKMKYPNGGKLPKYIKRDTVPLENPDFINGVFAPFATQVNWMENYVNSPKYRQRMSNFYTNPDPAINKRRQLLNNVEFRHVNTTNPADAGVYNFDDNTVRMNPSFNRLQGLNNETTKIHELGHAMYLTPQEESYMLDKESTVGGKNSVNIRKFAKDNKMSLSDAVTHYWRMHDYAPNELKSDIDAFRYMMNREGIYDAGTQDMNKDFLEKARSNKKVSTDPLFKRLQTHYNDDDLIDIMNKVASNNTNNTNMAKWGKTMKYDEGGDVGGPGKGTVAQRHNNPGNIKYAKWLEKFGAVRGEAAKDGGYFAVFPNIQSGQRAMVELLDKPMYRNKTVKDAIKTWTGGSSYQNIPLEIRNQTVGKLDAFGKRRLLDTITQGEDSKKYNWEGVDTPTGYTLPEVEVKAPRLRPSVSVPDVFGDPSTLEPPPLNQVPPMVVPQPIRPLGDLNIPNKKRLPSLADQNKLSFGQIAPELLTLATERRQFVPGQRYTPDLYTPYQISFQDQLNQNQATFSDVARRTGNNPSALGALAAQKYNADSDVLANEFRTNQGISNQITNQNTSLLNQAQLTNLELQDRQFLRQTQADANTRANIRGAISSISNKFSQNRAENNTIRLYENMFNYRPDENLQMNYMGPDPVFSAGIPNTVSPYQTNRTVYDKNGNVMRSTVITPSQLKVTQDLQKVDNQKRKNIFNRIF